MRILFIGNSHTFYNSMPFQVRELLRLHDPNAQVAMLAVGGVNLGWHAGQPTTRTAILYHDWDAIVLQQKTHPFDGAQALLDDCRLLQPYLKRSTAKVWMYMTWAEKKIPANQAVLDHAFTFVASEIGAGVAPVAGAWHRLRESDPSIEMYDIDQEHASPIGSYLVACTFYSLFTGRSAIGLPSRIKVRGDVLSDVDDFVARQVQEAVDATIR